MAGLKELRIRIGSVKSTRQITSAMKMVAAAKLKGAQDRITGFRPYAEYMSRIASSLTDPFDEKRISPYMLPNKSNAVLIVLFTSNRGLCGGFNNNMVKKTIEFVEHKYADAVAEKRLSFFCIGKKGVELIKRRGFVVERINFSLYDHINFGSATALSDELMQQFVSNQYGTVILAYNRFKNAGVQIQTIEQMLPVLPPENRKRPADYIFEPDAATLLNEVIPKTIRIQFYKALLDTNAAEQGARMTAMHQATDNATELIKELTLQYNKARQAAITNEILEITSGAEALKS
ncbi:MAG: ATP synthase F1 subunit gamma [Bacteroidales bacterium]|nr:ATP synthase F1 subunit gamma [Bacteroidales bacterium]